MKLTRKGKQVRAIVIYVLILIGMFKVTYDQGIWDTPESCLVEQVGCPDGHPMP